MVVSLAGPALGYQPEHLVKPARALAQFLGKIFSLKSPTAALIWREKINPAWYVELMALIEGTPLNIWPSPCRFGSHFVKFAKLRASCEGPVGNIQQGWRGVHVT